MSKPADLPDQHLDIIFYHGAYPLWQYLLEVVGINIVEVCPRVAKEEPILKTKYGDLAARTVDLPHEKEVDHMSNNDVIFLVNSVNVVFESLSAGIEKDGCKLLENYKFELDPNHNMILVNKDTSIPLSSKAIGIVKI